MSGSDRFSSRPRWGDFAVAGVLLLAALTVWLLCFSQDGAARTAVLLRDGAEVRRVSLSGLGEGTFPVEGENGVTATVAYGPGKIRFERADCPDQVCVATGWLTRPGQSAVCLPGRLVLRVEGEGDVDAVSG